MLLKSMDSNHYTIYKTRRCFEFQHRYYQLDIYEEPCKPCCRGLAILSTYVTEESDKDEQQSESSSIHEILPKDFFIEIDKEVTHDPSYSMFTLSLVNRKKIF